MKKAASIGDAAFAQLLSDIRPGVTESHLVKRLESYCSELGSEKPSFDSIVLFGERSALPHGKPGSTKLKKGSLVLIDFGCTVGGYASDMTRTVVAGNATERQRQLYRIVQDAQQNAWENACAGMAASAIDALARRPINIAGYGDQFGHALGHGVGRRIHEFPRISSKTSLVIPENTVITIENRSPPTTRAIINPIGIFTVSGNINIIFNTVARFNITTNLTIYKVTGSKPYENSTIVCFCLPCLYF